MPGFWKMVQRYECIWQELYQQKQMNLQRWWFYIQNRKTCGRQPALGRSLVTVNLGTLSRFRYVKQKGLENIVPIEIATTWIFWIYIQYFLKHTIKKYMLNYWILIFRMQFFPKHMLRRATVNTFFCLVMRDFYGNYASDFGVFYFFFSWQK